MIAVVATGSTVEELEQTTQRLIELQPLWDQVGIALSHAALFAAAQKEIDQRKQAEAALRESERVLLESQNVAQIGSYILDISSGVWESSSILDRIFGIGGDYERSVEGWLASVHPDHRKSMGNYLAHDVVAKQGRFDREYRIVRHDDGIERWVHGMGRLEFDGQGQPMRMIGTIQDVTQRKQLEEQQVHAERQSAATELAAGISHNLNNVLTAVLGPAEMLLEMSNDPAIRKEVELILSGGIRARDLVRRLSGSVRPTVGGDEAVELNHQIRETVELARPRWKDEPEARGLAIQVVAELDEIPPVRSNEGELSEVILNLLLNATDAMPEGGIITISTTLADAGDFVSLIVSDSGTGMDEETRRRVFEPFFTTKVDVGSGLGLSTAHGSVARAGGTIEVESELGHGTTFTVCLPVFEDVKAGEVAKAVADHRVCSGKILLVEDDAMVCEVLRRMLSDKHTVEVAHDGMDAVQRFSPGHFDVALIDLGIPTVPGDRVAADLRERDPSLVTVLITGWRLAEDDPRLSSFDFYLPKPFMGPDLEEIVAKAMTLHESRV